MPSIQTQVKSQNHSNTKKLYNKNSHELNNKTRNQNINQSNLKLNDENTILPLTNTKKNVMNHKNYIQRGQFYGPIYDVDHLATFTVGTRHGLLKAEDGMRKLRSMEKTQGIWTMDCQVLIDTNYLVVYDKKMGQEVEIFPLNLVNEPTSVVSDDKKDTYNNILLFTVLEDTKKHKSNSNNTPTEMHIFQCLKTHSAEIVDEILKAKEGRLPNHHIQSNNNNNNNNNNQHNHHHHHHHQTNKKVESFDIYRKYTQPIDNNNNANTIRRVNYNHYPKLNNADRHLATQIDIEVQMLNHCFDDIERFITRLQNSIEYLRELEKRQKQRKTNKKQLGDGMITMRAQMPPQQHFIDIFQKIKYSFNLLAKLKAHIHDPNAPELVHFLFTPLSLIVNTTKEQPYQGIGKTVWIPLMTKDAKDLLLNCLTSKEQDLWMSLGEGWTVTREEVKLQPHLYSHLDSQIYMPTFYDGWQPTPPQEPEIDIAKLAFDTAAQIQANSHKYNQPLPIQKTRYYSNTQPVNGEIDQFNDHVNNVKLNGINHTSLNNNNNNSNRSGLIRGYEEIKKWAIDITMRGGKIYEVIHDRQANNDKELTVRSGELVEVLDDKRNWWRLRNYYGQVGHAPITILRPFDYIPINQQNAQQQFTSRYNANQEAYPDKINEDNKNNNNNNNNNIQGLNLINLALSSSSSDSSRKEEFNDHSNQIPRAPPPPSFLLQQNQPKKKMLATINEMRVLLDPEENINNNNNEQVVFRSPRQHEQISMYEIEPIKGQLHSELAKRMSQTRYVHRDSSRKSNSSLILSDKSDSNEVKNFLEMKSFSNRVILILSELNGAQLFALNKNDFEKFCGKEEGARLDSLVKVQKSLCGYVDYENELEKVLQKRKEKIEVFKHEEKVK